jgi:glycosyltransferase involved in cell wall biosynthesis
MNRRAAGARSAESGTASPVDRSPPSQRQQRRAAVLYVTYDGLLEPLGYSQVFRYLQGLATDYEITIVSYEKAEDWADVPRRGALAAAVKQAGLRWVPLGYHKRPTAPATAYDLAVGFVVCAALTLRHRIRLVHARSYVPSVIAVAIKRLAGTRFLFDMRGFWADERVESGIWRPGSRLFHVAKWFERQFLRQADAVVSLTRAGAEALEHSPAFPVRPARVAVIPTCTDLQVFAPHARLGAVGATGRLGFTLGYVGNAGLWYMFDVTLRCFAALLDVRPDARLLVLNRGQHDYIRQCVAALEVPSDRVTIKAVDPAAVPGEIAHMDAGAFFIRPTFAKLASAPTKLGEFLGCGIPCLANAGVGDVEQILESEGVGVALKRQDADEIRAGIRRLVALATAPDIAPRCRAVAEKYFDIRLGNATYRQLYAELLGSA